MKKKEMLQRNAKIPHTHSQYIEKGKRYTIAKNLEKLINNKDLPAIKKINKKGYSPVIINALNIANLLYDENLQTYKLLSNDEIVESNEIIQYETATTIQVIVSAEDIKNNVLGISFYDLKKICNDGTAIPTIKTVDIEKGKFLAYTSNILDIKNIASLNLKPKKATNLKQNPYINHYYILEFNRYLYEPLLKQITGGKVKPRNTKEEQLQKGYVDIKLLAIINDIINSNEQQISIDEITPKQEQSKDEALLKRAERIEQELEKAEQINSFFEAKYKGKEAEIKKEIKPLANLLQLLSTGNKQEKAMFDTLREVIKAANKSIKKPKKKQGLIQDTFMWKCINLVLFTKFLNTNSVKKIEILYTELIDIVDPQDLHHRLAKNNDNPLAITTRKRIPEIYNINNLNMSKTNEYLNYINSIEKTTDITDMIIYKITPSENKDYIFIHYKPWSKDPIKIDKDVKREIEKEINKQVNKKIYTKKPKK